MQGALKSAPAGAQSGPDRTGTEFGAVWLARVAASHQHCGSIYTLGFGNDANQGSLPTQMLPEGQKNGNLACFSPWIPLASFPGVTDTRDRVPKYFNKQLKQKTLNNFNQNWELRD